MSERRFTQYTVQLVDTEDEPHYWEVKGDGELVGRIALDQREPEPSELFMALALGKWPTWIGSFPTVLKAVNELVLYDRMMRGEIGL